MQNTIDYNAFEMGGSTYNFNITDYTSTGLNKIRSYLNTLGNSYFVYLKVEENTKIEKVCYDYYNNTNYYDLILLLNNKEMILVYGNKGFECGKKNHQIDDIRMGLYDDLCKVVKD